MTQCNPEIFTDATAGNLLGLFFNPKDADILFARNVGDLLPYSMTLYTKDSIFPDNESPGNIKKS
jgi:hypothetical protein